MGQTENKSLYVPHYFPTFEMDGVMDSMYYGVMRLWDSVANPNGNTMFTQCVTGSRWQYLAIFVPLGW